MKKVFYLVMFLSGVLLFSPTLAFAQDQAQEQNQQQKRVFGWDLMTPEERAQHRETMRNMKTEEEREAYRMEHHKRMMERAKQKGVELPPYKPGMGMGGGMGRYRNQ